MKIAAADRDLELLEPIDLSFVLTPVVPISPVGAQRFEEGQIRSKLPHALQSRPASARAQDGARSKSLG
jgi:hypothetical protein